MQLKESTRSPWWAGIDEHPLIVKTKNEEKNIFFASLSNELNGLFFLAILHFGGQIKYDIAINYRI